LRKKSKRREKIRRYGKWHGNLPKTGAAKPGRENRCAEMLRLQCPRKRRLRKAAVPFFIKCQAAAQNPSMQPPWAENFGSGLKTHIRIQKTADFLKNRRFYLR